MRLAQIARKVGMTPNDIKRFLESEFDLNIGKEPNYKLDDIQVDAVLNRFPIPEPVEVVVEYKPEPTATVKIEEEEEVEEIVAEKAVEIVASNVSEDEAVENESNELTEELIEETIEAASTVTEEPEIQPKKVINTPVVEINYESTGEETASERAFIPVPVDANAELIKAPTIKLDGLKILGKIELPETKKVELAPSAEEIEKSEMAALAQLDAAMQAQEQDVKKVTPPSAEKPITKKVVEAVNDDPDAAFKDVNGIYHFSAEQRANRIQSIQNRAARRREIDQKEKKRRYYEEILAQRKDASTPAKAKKLKPKKVEAREQKKRIEKPKPTTLWGKFVYWLND